MRGTFKNRIVAIIYFFLISYLLVYTGPISDDFDAMTATDRDKVYFIAKPVLYLTHAPFYRISSIDNQVPITIAKIVYILISFYLIAKFFTIYLSEAYAYMASFLFIFFPTHDSTVYFFMAQYLTLSFGFYLYAFYLLNRDKMIFAFFMGLLASFISYGSTPLAVALSVLFLLNRYFRKALVILVPNIIYILYFISVNILLRISSPRILETVNAIKIAKQLMLQIFTFFDAVVGPSCWLKIYYSFQQISVVSFMVGIIIALFLYKKWQDSNRRYDTRLIISFTVLIFSSFLLFAITGRYPQIAFNLGNRTTIYGTLLLSYLIVLVPLTKKIKIFIILLLVFSILGISDHWKKWDIQQQKIITQIRNNGALRYYSDNRPIYISGYQYSRYGIFGHGEFFSEDWMASSILKMSFNRDIHAKSINKRHKYLYGYLIDSKYNSKEEINDYINVYDSEKNIFFRLYAKDINKYIASLNEDKRHWVQILDFKFIKDLVIKLMPRLQYAF